MGELGILLWVVLSRVAIAGAIVFVLTQWPRREPRVLRHLVVSTVLVTAAGVAGVIVLLGNGDAWLAVFFGLPAVAGAASVLLGPRGGYSSRVGAGVTGIVLTSSMLILLGLEGLVCCLLAFPLLAASYAGGVLVGVGVGFVLRAGIALCWPGRDDTTVRGVATALLLVALPGAKDLELHRATGARVEPIESRIRITATPPQIWAALEEIDAVHGPKPLLLRIGLPVPTMCEMDGTGVGARRTCHFDVGRIEERVSVWDPPRRMELEIVHWTLPGRHWLGYESASYELRETAPGETEVSRVTTITSNLRPAWYWRPLERAGVRAEHDYLLRDVKRRLETATEPRAPQAAP